MKLGAASVLFALLTYAFAQGPTAFDVVSIKPNKSGQREQFYQLLPGGRFRATNISLKMLIMQAYEVQEFQISGGPEWLSSERFDIEAKGEASSTELRQMIRSLLADRFQLALRQETTQLPVYNLLVTRRGCKLRQWHAEGGTASGPMHIDLGEIEGSGVEISAFAHLLSIAVSRPVIDKTALLDKYDINLHWTPDENQARILRLDARDDRQAPEASGPTIFTAIQEQLGLKLQPAKGPVVNLVVDHAERPSEN